jgi:hypothetical protein
MDRYTDAIKAENYILARELLIEIVISKEYKQKDIDKFLATTVNLNKLKDPPKNIVVDRRYMTTTEIYESLEKFDKPSFRIRNEKVRIIDDNFVLSINWRMYRDMLKAINKSHLIHKYKIHLRVWDQKLLKNLSVVMLEKGPAFEEDFYLMVGIENLYGYNHAAVKEDQTEKLRAWVQNDFKPIWHNSTDLYLRQFNEEVAKVLRWKPGTQEASISIDDFCVNVANTGTTGSAFDPGGTRLSLSIEGIDKDFKPMNNKFSKSAALSVSNKVDRIRAFSSQKAKVSVKVEPLPKVRLIISSDFNTHLKMRWVDTWLAKWMAGNTESTLWQDTIATRDMWLDFCTQGTWNIPIDQSAFDHHVTRDMVLGMLMEIKILIQERATGDPAIIVDLLLAMDTLIHSMLNTEILYTNPITKVEVILKYYSGILSGWQWTAFLDTLANIAQKNLAKRHLLEDGISITFLSFNAQGDDQFTRFEWLYEGILYWLTLTSAGYDIHPSKNFFSTKHNEYLRKYSTDLGINGYPARMINKLMWLYPGKQEVVNTQSLLNNIYSRWDKLRERCFSTWSIFKKFLFMDYRGAKLNKEVVLRFLGAHKVNGGKQVSFVPSNNFILNTIPGTWQYHIDIHGKGYQQFQEIFGVGQIREMDDWFLQAIQMPDVIDHTEIKPKPSLDIIEGTEVVPIEFALTNDLEPISKPQIIPGWQYNEIFSNSNDIMTKLFPTIESFVQHTNAPKSWVYDFVLGKLKVVTPNVTNFSEEGVSLAFKEYENSIFSAMYQKRPAQDKWKRLQAGLAQSLPMLIAKDKRYPPYFYV